jgi:hypothetical protein
MRRVTLEVDVPDKFSASEVLAWIYAGVERCHIKPTPLLDTIVIGDRIFEKVYKEEAH